jgi:HEAT repeat protein
LSIVVWFSVVSWTLCGLAMLAVLGLVAYRVFANRHLEMLRLERQHYIELLRTDGDSADIAPSARANDVLTDLTLDILELVRGDEKTRIAERAAKSGSVERLRWRLRRGDVRTRILAAATLAHFSDEATRQALTVALDDRNSTVRLTAAISLAQSGHAPAPLEVVRKLGIDDRELSLLSLTLLLEIARARVEDVRALLRHSQVKPPVKAAAAQALAMIDDFAAVPIVAALAEDCGPAAAELPHYLSALGEFGHPDGATAVEARFVSPSADVRAAAASAAGNIRTVSALDGLERLVGDSDWWVRLRSAQALLRFGDLGAQRLQRLAVQAGEPARETAELILAESISAT